MGQWGWRSEGCFASSAFLLQLWEEGALKGLFFFLLDTYLYTTLCGCVCGFLFFPRFSKFFAPSESKQQWDHWSRDGEHSWERRFSHRFLPLALARSRYPRPAQTWAHTERIPLDIPSQLPRICCWRIFCITENVISVFSSSCLTAPSRPQCPCCCNHPLAHGMSRNSFSSHLEITLMGFILISQNWGNVAARLSQSSFLACL